MTEPKHIPLPKRWSDDFHQFVQDRADSLAEAVGWVLDLVPHPIQAAMKAYDDAHEIEDEDRKPEVWGGGCECWVTPEHLWTTHYGAVEPGSQLEFNPDCPKHGKGQ